LRGWGGALRKGPRGELMGGVAGTGGGSSGTRDVNPVERFDFCRLMW